MARTVQGVPTWAHKKRFCRFEDPIALVFQGTTLTTILAHLDDLHRISNGSVANWRDPKLWFKTLADDLFLLSQFDCGKKQDAHRVYGGRFWKRYHVRFWQDGDYVVAGAHFEYVSGIRHRVCSFEDGEQLLADHFLLDPSWNVERAAIDLRNATDDPENDGHATRISK